MSRLQLARATKILWIICFILTVVLVVLFLFINACPCVGFDSAADDAAAQIAAAREARLRGAKPSAENVDEFVPEGGLGDDFLGDDSGAVAMGTADDDDDDRFVRVNFN